jgi:hypothetical protein
VCVCVCVCVLSVFEQVRVRLKNAFSVSLTSDACRINGFDHVAVTGHYISKYDERGEPCWTLNHHVLAVSVTEGMLGVVVW